MAATSPNLTSAPLGSAPKQDRLTQSELPIASTLDGIDHRPRLDEEMSVSQSGNSPKLARSSSDRKAPSEKIASKGATGIELERSLTTFFLVALFAGLTLFSWIVICILVYRPIAKARYGKCGALWRISNADVDFRALFWLSSTFYSLQLCSGSILSIARRAHRIPEKRTVVPCRPRYSVNCCNPHYSRHILCLRKSKRHLRSTLQIQADSAPNNDTGRQGLGIAGCLPQAGL